MRRALAAGAAVALTAAGFAGAGAAAAQASCVGERTANPATVTPTTLLPGQSLTLTGGGFEPNKSLGIGLFSPPVILATVASDANGNYTATVQIPSVTRPGQNEITVFGPGPDSTCHESLGLFTVQAPPIPVPVPTVPPVVVVDPRHQPHPPVTVVVKKHDPRPDRHYEADDPKHEERDEPLARTGSASPALVAGGLLVMLVGAHLVRAGRPRHGIRL